MWTQTVKGRIAAGKPGVFARNRVPTEGRVLQAEGKEEKGLQSQAMSIQSR
jgi:hypothetical protein